MSSATGSLALLLLQADSVQLRRSKSRGKLLATFSEQGRVEIPVFGGSWPVEDCWTYQAEAATLAGRRTLLTMEKVMLQSDLVLWRTEITLMIISWASPISGY